MSSSVVSVIVTVTVTSARLNMLINNNVSTYGIVMRYGKIQPIIVT